VYYYYQSNCRAWKDVCIYHMFEYVREIGIITVLMLGKVLTKYGTLTTYLGEAVSFTSSHFKQRGVLSNV